LFFFAGMIACLSNSEVEALQWDRNAYVILYCMPIVKWSDVLEGFFTAI